MFGHDFDQLKQERLIVEQPIVGWVQKFVDAKVGGWRLAPRLLAQ